MKRTSISILILCTGLTSVVWTKEQKAGKPLAGYTAIQVEPFTVENSPLTKDFPAGEETSLQLLVIGSLRVSGMFEKVDDGIHKSSGKPPTSEPSAKEERREVILSSTIIGFDKGNSGSRFMTWPLPIGISKAKVRFVFRDAMNNQELFRFEKEAKSQAATSAGIATKEQEMSHIKVGLADGLVKEIKRNR